MTFSSRQKVRGVTRQTRRPPRSPARIVATYDLGGDLVERISPGPVEIVIEATNEAGELAPWFDDAWWTELIQRRGDDPVTIHIRATPGALLHPVVLHQVEMIRRVTPIWRIIGTAIRDDLATDEAIALVARSLYHLVRFHDESDAGAAETGSCPPHMPIDELFGRIRREQKRLGVTGPGLVRLPASDRDPTLPGLQKERLAHPERHPRQPA